MVKLFFWTAVSLAFGQDKVPSMKHAVVEAPPRPFALGTPLEAITPPPNETVKRWTSLLGAKTYQERSRAHRELQALGEGVLNAPDFHRALASKDAEVKRRAMDIDKKLREPYSPVQGVELMQCLAKIAKELPTTLMMRRLLDDLNELAKQARQFPLQSPKDGSNEKECNDYNLAFEKRVVLLKKVLSEKGYQLIGDVGITVRIGWFGSDRSLAEGHRFDLTFSGQVFSILLRAGELEVLPIVKSGEAAQRSHPINLDENRCFETKKASLGKLLPKSLKPGVLQDAELKTSLSLRFDGSPAEMSFEVASRTQKQPSAWVPCCGQELLPLATYLFEPNSEDLKVVEDWPENVGPIIPRELFFK